MLGIKNYIRLLCIVFLLGASAEAFAQTDWRYEHINSAQGLSQSVVTCIYQDTQGFMWFGTQDGLNRFDGYSVTVLKNNPIDSNSLISNTINCILEDSHGLLWIGTDAGLSALNIYTGKFTNYATINSSLDYANNVHVVYQDNEGGLWIGTGANNLSEYNYQTRKFTTYSLTTADTSASTSIYISSITEDATGKLWVGSWGGGLYCFDKKTKKYENFFQKVDHRFAFSYLNKINTMCLLKEKNELIIGTQGSGVESFKIQSKNFTTYYKPEDTAHLASPRMIKCITLSKNGKIWVAEGNGNGIYKFIEEEGRFVQYEHQKQGTSASTKNKFCNTIFFSPDGIMWVGTNGGVDYYIPQRRNFIIDRDTANQDANVIMAIAHDASGKLWLGTNGGGLLSFDESTKTYTQNETLAKVIGNKSILSLCIDKKDNLWIGSWGSGVSSYNLLTEKKTSLDSLNPLLDQTTVTAITEDHTGKIWIGTYGKGIFIYDENTKSIQSLNTNNGLNDNRIYCLYEDHEHTMWIGTDGSGIDCDKLSDGKITFIKKTSGTNTLSSNSVNCVYEDPKGNMWIGTGIGLNEYIPSSQKFKHYFEKDGLPNDYVYSILPDKDGNLWMSTNKGISKFNPNTTNEGGSAFKNYDESDGLWVSEFNQGASLITADGRMYFGSINGTVSFYPEKVTGNTHIPDVSITSFELFGKEYNADSLITKKKSLTLSWRENTLGFSFVGLDYEMPSKNRYMYMLEGADKDWSPPSTRHFASYAQLPPGDYIFHVKASNNDGVWNNIGSSIYIHIVPPFWRTNWFYATCIILIIASVFGFIKFRTRQVEKEKKILETKVEERTSELAQKNRDITSSIQYAKRIQQAILPPVEEIKKHLPESFVLYLPKDIVSGDFYWFGEKAGKIILVAADCTGHGVPGALMSMIGHNLLNQIVLEKGVTNPSTVLNQLNSMVQTALKQGISNIDTSDGMDMAFCCIDKSTNELHYAGANRPLIIVDKNGDVKKIEPDKKPIGGSQIGLERSFASHSHKLQKGETVYMFSDGYADQFGGDKGKKFMLKRFIDKLVAIHGTPMPDQEKTLLDAFYTWQGNCEQVDDILVIGIHNA
ncbi:MAG TPA: two-component regulator propeller domain-containing protein [Bacteroidia bacterium]|nr:two-component regulator propeller domain-containing protein [Bacteroidia bacterium]